MEIKLSPEWILDKLPQSTYGDGQGGFEIWVYENSYHWIELALKTSGIPYTEDDFVDEFDKTIVRFNLKLEDLREECPSLFFELNELDKNNDEKYLRLKRFPH
jgi:hypothetical protein